MLIVGMIFTIRYFKHMYQTQTHVYALLAYRRASTENGKHIASCVVQILATLRISWLELGIIRPAFVNLDR